MIPAFLANISITSLFKWGAVAVASAFIFYNGYLWGSSDKASVQKELDRVLAESKAQGEIHERIQLALKNQVAAVSDQFSARLEELVSLRNSVDQQWEKEVSDTQSKLAKAEASLKLAKASAKEVEDSLAKALLGGAPEEIKALQEELRKRNAELDALLSRKEGLACMGTPIPEEFIRVFNSAGVLP